MTGAVCVVALAGTVASMLTIWVAGVVSRVPMRIVLTRLLHLNYRARVSLACIPLPLQAERSRAVTVKTTRAAVTNQNRQGLEIDSV